MPAYAHDPGLSGIRIEYRQNDIVVKVSTHISRLIRAESPGKIELSPVELDQAIRRRLHIRFNGEDLVPATAEVNGDDQNDSVTWQITVPATNCSYSNQPCEVLARIYPEDDYSRTVVSIVEGDNAVAQCLLDADHPDLLRQVSTLNRWSVACRFAHEGILHIFGGPDHVMFVVGLLLLSRSLMSIVKCVTAFTLAHSITLSVAATGLWDPSPRFVEPLIAFSIVAVAVENLRQLLRSKSGLSSVPNSLPEPTNNDTRPNAAIDMRPFYALGFGLVHGFGFAGALAEVGLPQSALWVALGSFNAGVEIGQMAIILAAFPVIAWLAKYRPKAFCVVAYSGSCVIGITGAYWFFERLLTN
jgi:hypothetical protein